MAIEEIHQFAVYALRQGGYKRLDNGAHYLSRDGFRIWLSPDARMVTGYRTLHSERTPSQVRAGRVRSRFKEIKKGSGRHGPPGPTLRLDEMAADVDPARIAISASAMNSFAKSHGTRAKDPLVEGWLRQELAQALRTGTWAPAKSSEAYFSVGTTAAGSSPLTAGFSWQRSSKTTPPRFLASGRLEQA